MNDRLKETLSAMMDDQADELSVRRVLAHSDQAEVRDQWQRWQQIRGLMHGTATLDGATDVSHPVPCVLDGHGEESSPPVVESPRVRRHLHWTAAAMVAVGVLAGFGMGTDWGDGGSSDALVAVSGPPAAVVVPEVALQGLDEQQWEHLSRYLLEHAQHNSVGAGRGAVGYARLASVSGSGY